MARGCHPWPWDRAPHLVTDGSTASMLNAHATVGFPAFRERTYVGTHSVCHMTPRRAARGFATALALALIGTALLPVSAMAASEPSVVATVTVGISPTAVAITPDGTKAVVANYDSASISIIDIQAATSTTVAVGTSPSAVAITPDGQRAVVTNYGSGTASIVSLASNSVTNTVTLASGARPGSVVISADGTRAFVADGGIGVNLIEQITIATATITGSVVATLPGGLVMAPDGETVYATAAVSGQVTYFNTTTLAAGSISLTGSAGTPANSLAVSPDNSTIYAVRGLGYQLLSLLSASSHTLTSTSTVGTSPRDVAVRPDGARVYVTNGGDNTVSVLNSTGTVLSTIPVGAGPDQVAFTPDGAYALVTNDTSNTVSFINTATESVEFTVNVGAGARGLGITASGTKALVLNNTAGTVSIINTPVTEVVGGPTAALQQYGIAQSGACGVSAPDSVLLPALGESVRNYGWGSSWAQWPNGGQGGYVCTRQPLYTTSGWLIAP